MTAPTHEAAACPVPLTAGRACDDGASDADAPDLTTERELRRMVLIHRRSLLAARRPARAVATSRR